ncbi:energy transducer TonB [Stenotrophomonas panacihumi]|uniref:Protein TonB n=1 Tax=Stenotrophomonas panacihumi TaxID=676599 RepID=A0A0R0ALA8_9GAMM|nr:energy transducer TonB [Stenotrophomonas panacihumi]KRG45983.1 energy transducer TonB [Stenotrophomonas panacihumi]PTN56349.1 energy transducer TonB [Stenotrophomonas panacihumi]
MLDLSSRRAARLAVPVLLLVALAACSKKEEAQPAAATTPATGGAATPAPAATTPAEAPAATPDTAVSAQVQAMSVDQLREAASLALRENRMYAPTGNNAVEYYLALRDKQPQDATVKSALTDLTPYTLIAAEQSINREDFPEAQRLIALIEKVDDKAPALPRLKAGVTNGVQNAATRTAQETEKLKKQTEEKAQQLVEQKKLADQQAKEAEAARQIAAQQETARAEAERQAAAKREADQRAAAAAAAAAPKPAASAPTAAAAAAATLRPISTPAPRYPPEALRAGTSGEVLVEITVGTDGSVTSSRVLRANPARVFDREALNATKRWKFEPVAAPVTTRRTLSFSPGT